MEDREMLGDRIESTVSSILALCDVAADPVQSREHILLSNIIAHCWSKKQNVTIEEPRASDSAAADSQDRR